MGKGRLVTLVVFLLAGAWTHAQLGGAVGGEGGRGGGLGGGRGPEPGPVKTVWVAVGPVSVAENEEISALVALGPVTIDGRVSGDVTSIGGRVSLGKNAVVHGNVTAICAPVEVADGAKVAGEVRRDELPEMASIAVGWPGTQAAVLRVGEVEITDAGDAPGWMVGVGGNVTARKGVKAGEIVVIGGDLVVEPGAEVATARVIGGQIRRPEGQSSEKDEIIDGVVFPCLGEDRPDSPASRSSAFSVSQATDELQFRMSTAGSNGARLDLSARGEGGDLSLSVAAEAVGRYPESMSLRRRYGGGGPGPRTDRWQAAYNQSGPITSSPQAVSPDSDPDFAKSAAVGVGLQIIVTATDEEGRRGERTIRIGVPTGAEGLLGPVLQGYGGGGGYGGGATGGGGGRW